jgi:Terminase small subunit
MPVLSNPRHEAFAQAIFSGIVGAKGGAHSQAEAYRRAGYHVINGNSARACASRLLTFANGIAERVRELQEEAAERAQESADKCVQELNQLRRDAHSDKAYGAAVAAVMGKAKILNLIVDQPQTNPIDFNQANSMQDIGRKLLQSVGFASPDELSIQAAIEANDVFIAELEQIRDSAQRLTLKSGRLD